jgi:hypothetical protein
MIFLLPSLGGVKQSHETFLMIHSIVQFATVNKEHNDSDAAI